MVHLQVGGLVGHIGVSSRVRLIKAVASELFHQVEDFRGDTFFHATLTRALHKDSTLAFHFFDVFLTHGATQ